MRQSLDNERAADPTSPDVMFDVLRNSYRRRILLAVSDYSPSDEGEFTLPEFATDEQDLTELRPVLYHTHLPKLAEYGYIEWDPDTETIRQGPHFGEIAPLLAVLVDHRDELPADWL
jgi:hypothetical protein